MFEFMSMVISGNWDIESRLEQASGWHFMVERIVKLWAEDNEDCCPIVMAKEDEGGY